MGEIATGGGMWMGEDREKIEQGGSRRVQKDRMGGQI